MALENGGLPPALVGPRSDFVSNSFVTFVAKLFQYLNNSFGVLTVYIDSSAVLTGSI